jgi:hypothetical protein
LSHVAVAVPSFLFCTHIRLSRWARSFAATSSNAHSPCDLGFYGVVKVTLNVAPCQVYHAIAVVNYRVYVAEAGKICAVYQMVAKREVCTHRTLCARRGSLP